MSEKQPETLEDWADEIVAEVEKRLGRSRYLPVSILNILARHRDSVLEEAASALVAKEGATLQSRTLIAFCQGKIRSMKGHGHR